MTENRQTNETDSYDMRWEHEYYRICRMYLSVWCRYTVHTACNIFNSQIYLTLNKSGKFSLLHYTRKADVLESDSLGFVFKTHLWYELRDRELLQHTTSYWFSIFHIFSLALSEVRYHFLESPSTSFLDFSFSFYLPTLFSSISIHTKVLHFSVYFHENSIIK